MIPVGVYLGCSNSLISLVVEWFSTLGFYEWKLKGFGSIRLIFVVFFFVKFSSQDLKGHLRKWCLELNGVAKYFRTNLFSCVWFYDLCIDTTSPQGQKAYRVLITQMAINSVI